MSLKENVNRIHSELSDKYSVKFEEGSDRKFGNFVKFSIVEGNKNIVAIISKSDLVFGQFNWNYLSNPLNESSDMIERTSTVSEFTSHVSDIFEKNRFDSEYLKNIN
jgi:hypothetical protein